MSNNRGPWINRRGQVDATTAIDQVIDHQPQPGEQIQQILDELIEDSPYQARQPFSDESVEELAQGMREVGFQGVLIVRPHGDPPKRRRGMFQLVYGHRRRAAWRRVCVERGESCLLPVIVREVSDERMLVIGAQENLQRQDLDPVEEAQLVAWHQRLFSEKNQAEIGAMLGKSSDWVSVRARIHKLPDALKARLRQRPRAISQMLELGTFHGEQPAAAVELADRVVQENLTLEVVRNLVRGYARPEPRAQYDREGAHNRRGAATSVQDVTSESPAIDDTHHEGRQRDASASPITSRSGVDDRVFCSSPDSGMVRAAADVLSDDEIEDATAIGIANQHVLQEAVVALASVVSQAEHLRDDSVTTGVLDQIEQALMSLRRALVRRTLPENIPAQHGPYRLINTDLREMFVLLHHHRPVVTTLHSMRPQGPVAQLVMCLLPKGEVDGGLPNTNVGDLFVAIVGAGNGTVPFINGVPVEWVRNHLQITEDEAASVAALISDLASGQTTLQAFVE